MLREKRLKGADVWNLNLISHILFTTHLREGVEVEVVGVCAAIEMPGV